MLTKKIFCSENLHEHYVAQPGSQHLLSYFSNIMLLSPATAWWGRLSLVFFLFWRAEGFQPQSLLCLGRLEQWLGPAEQLVTVCLHFVFPTNAAASEKIPIALPMHVVNGQWETLANFMWGLSPITRSCCQTFFFFWRRGAGRGEDVVSVIVVVVFYFVLRSFSLSLESLKPKAIYSRILGTTTRIACGKSSCTQKVLFRDIFSAPENEKQFNRWGKN